MSRSIGKHRRMALGVAATGLVALGICVGVLFQEFYGAGRVLRALNVTVTGRSLGPVSPAPRPAMEDGLPEDHFGQMSLFVLAGQSNMSGWGELPDSQSVHPRVFVFGNDYRWRPAIEPVDDPTNQVDPVSRDAFTGSLGYGPGLSFGIQLAELRPELRVALIPCAKGNTTIHEWRRSLSDATLYGSCLKRLRAASPAGEVAGILFFQGEADALNPGPSPSRLLTVEGYARSFSMVIDDLRRDIGSRAPLVFAQIGTTGSPQGFTNWEPVREEQARVALPCAAMITTDDLALSDGVHYTTESYRIIGERFAHAYVQLIDGPERMTELAPYRPAGQLSEPDRGSR